MDNGNGLRERSPPCGCDFPGCRRPAGRRIRFWDLLLYSFDHLVAQRRLSLQTVASYRDTFRLLLQFVHRETGIEPVALKIPGLDAEIILRFLDALEKDRGNTVVSRNLRLTAIRSFYRMVALRDPASVGIATRVLAIP
jgi:integrase/recombinase XerD